jgi:hypothetical protein
MLIAALCDVPVPLALAAWLVIGLCGVRAWSAIERTILIWQGARPPSRLERERLAAVGTGTPDQLLVLDAGEPFLVHGYRHVIITRALLDVLDDRALLGLLTQAAQPAWSVSVAGEVMVWLAVLPLVGAWLINGWLSLLGRALAVVIGWSLVLPMLLWPVGFVSWVGRALGALLAMLLGVVLVSSGLSAAGCALILTWAVVPGLHALLAWEWRRTERLADRATMDAGLGRHLLEALELLAWMDAVPRPPRFLGLLVRQGDPVWQRSDRLSHKVGQL